MLKVTLTHVILNMHSTNQLLIQQSQHLWYIRQLHLLCTQQHPSVLAFDWTLSKVAIYMQCSVAYGSIRVQLQEALCLHSASNL